MIARPLALFCAALTVAGVARANIDLGIADDETYKRPNSWSLDTTSPHPGAHVLAGDSSGSASRAGVSIAWRNANQVEEVEVRVRNLGSEAGEGHVIVDVLDQSGKQLLRLEPPDDQKVLRLPAIDRGGKEGKIVRMKASWRLNALIDRFDLSRTRYHIRATVETLNAADANPLDNSKVKSWNIPFRVNPGMTNVYNYQFTNHETKPIVAKWMFEHTPYPNGWLIQGVPDEGQQFTLNPGESKIGSLLMTAPNEIKEGEFLEARLSVVDTEKNQVHLQNEWFQVYDTTPPVVTDYRMVLLDDGQIATQALVTDQGSGVMEATGVSTEFSVDGGRRWSRTTAAYKNGNFVRPTLFESVIGPFRHGTEVLVRFSARDTAGNETAVIPTDAVAMMAPPGSNLLLQTAYLFPRTKSNPIFDIDKLHDIQRNLRAMKGKGIELENVNFLERDNPAGVDPERLRQLGVGPTQFYTVIEDLRRIENAKVAADAMKVVSIERLDTDIDRFLHLTTLRVTAR